MATAAIIEQTPTHSEILARVDDNPACVLLGEYTADQVVEAIRTDIAGHDHDPSTVAGRKGITSDAFKIRQRKAAIDKTRLSMTAEWRRLTTETNANGKAITDKLDALAEEVRAPVSAWEAAEEKRKLEADEIIADLSRSAVASMGETLDSLDARLDRIRGINLNGDVLGVRLDMAQDLQRKAIVALTEAVEQKRAQEAAARELEQLRREREEAQRRAEQEAAERMAKERAEQAAKDEAERIAKAAQEAADRARREAEEAAEQAERERQAQARAAEEERQRAARQLEDRRHYARQIIEHIKQVGLGMIGGQTYPYVILIRELEEKIEINDSLGDMQEEVRAIRDLTLQNVKDAQQRQAERRAAEDAEAERQAEQQRIADKAAAEEAARRKREADLAHRQQVIDTAAEKLTELGLTKKLATAIMHEIAAGNVPAVSIAF